MLAQKTLFFFLLKKNPFKTRWERLLSGRTDKCKSQSGGVSGSGDSISVTKNFYFLQVNGSER